MNRSPLLVLVLFAAITAVGCTPDRSPPHLSDKPLYKQRVVDIDLFLRAEQQRQPTFNERVIEIARRNIGQPYDMYLLGEAPFEEIDDQPVYCLTKSDCVVFTEHTIAMALSNDIPSFLRVLQRIRYNDGYIGVLTRNHYTEADWNVNNGWLATDITEDVAGDRAKSYSSTVDRKTFFKKRYKLGTDFPKQKIDVRYVPYQIIPEVKSKLRTGDIVEFVKGTADNSAWVHHMGLVAVMPDGVVHIIHSSEPRVREEPIEAFIARNTKDNAKNDAKKKPRHRGFKFLRLADDPMANLRKLDGSDAPRVVVPEYSPVTWEQFVETVIPTTPKMPQ